MLNVQSRTCTAATVAQLKVGSFPCCLGKHELAPILRRVRYMVAAGLCVRHGVFGSAVIVNVILADSNVVLSRVCLALWRLIYI